MNPADAYKIGFILKPHGLKGGVTISIDNEIGVDVSSLKSVFVELEGNLVPFFIHSISVNGNKAFVKFEEVDTIEHAEEISKKKVLLPKSERPKSGRGEFYEDEIIGFQVTDEIVGALGTIEDIVSAGPNKLLLLIHDQREILIPVNSPFITSINKGKKKVTVNLPDGFLDI